MWHVEVPEHSGLIPLHHGLPAWLPPDPGGRLHWCVQGWRGCCRLTGLHRAAPTKSRADPTSRSAVGGGEEEEALGQRKGR